MTSKMSGWFKKNFGMFPSWNDSINDLIVASPEVYEGQIYYDTDSQRLHVYLGNNTWQEISFNYID